MSMAIFHCYVSSPEGNVFFPKQFWEISAAQDLNQVSHLGVGRVLFDQVAASDGPGGPGGCGCGSAAWTCWTWRVRAMGDLHPEKLQNHGHLKMAIEIVDFPMKKWWFSIVNR